MSDKMLIVSVPSINAIGASPVSNSMLIISSPSIKPVGAVVQPAVTFVQSGAQGPAGTIGAQGSVGPVGPTGPTGPMGTTGSTGIVVETAPSTFAARTLATLAAALTITNANGVVGNPTFDLSTELKAVAALATTGYVKRTGAATWITSATVPYADLTGTPTTLAGYGITDAYTKTASDARFAPIVHTHAWTDITSTPTTLAGYGITDAYTKTASDARYQPIDSDLTALAALATGGIAVQTAVGTWAQRTITAGANVGVTNGSGVGGNPTIAVTSLDSAPVGATTPSTGAFTTFSATGAGTLPGSGGWLSTGEYGVLVGASTDTGVLVGRPSSAATTLFAVRANYTGPTTATASAQGFSSTIASTASAYTLTEVAHFVAALTTKGAGSTITNSRGFYAKNAIVIGTNNYGFYSDINSATTTWQMYMAGSAHSYFLGPVGIGPAASDASGSGAFLFIGNGTHPSAAANLFAINMNYTGPSTATNVQAGMQTILSTTGSAYTLASMIHFFASSSTKGATSAITTVYGFRVSNNIAAGTTNYGFFSDINASTANYQFYASGTAPSFFSSAGGIAIGAAGFNPVTSNFLIGFANSHTGTGTSVMVIGGSIRGPATATALLAYYQALLLSNAFAYTLTDMIGFHATTFTLGAGSTVTNAKAFAASNVFAIASNNFGFWTDLNTGATSYAFYGAGTAKSLFGGAIIEKEVTVTYSASMTLDASLGNEQIITATNATAFTINAPTNPATGQYLEVTIRNTSGGALGVATWDVVFKMTAWNQPANTFSRTIFFRYNGTNWIEKGRTAADVPN